jgi:hypothetical protein
MVVEPRKKAANAHRRKEGLLIRATTKQEKQCRVRSETNDPCLRPAVVEVRGVPFCEPCAREQEAYFAIGELTEVPDGLREKSLVELLNRMRRTTWRRGVHADEPNAA